MSVLAILTCEVLEDEIAHILLNDPEIKRITAIQSDYSRDIYQKLATSEDIELAFVPNLSLFQPSEEGLEVIVEVLEVGLHMIKERLKNGVTMKIKELESHCDCILLGYGLCGNSLEKLDEEVKDISVPVIMPVNNDGSRIDDCVCLVLGGTEYYLEEVKKVAGTWFVTPGWLKHWETLLLRELGAKDIKTVKWIFDKVGYSRVLMVNAHTSDEEKFLANSLEFAGKFNFYTEERKGTLEILEKAYRNAKARASDERTRGMMSLRRCW